MPATVVLLWPESPEWRYAQTLALASEQRRLLKAWGRIQTGYVLSWFGMLVQVIVAAVLKPGTHIWLFGALLWAAIAIAAYVLLATSNQRRRRALNAKLRELIA